MRRSSSYRSPLGNGPVPDRLRAALLCLVALSCTGSDSTSPSGTTAPPPNPDSPSSLVVHLAASAANAGTGDTIQVRIEAEPPASTSLAGLSGTVQFDPARLRYASPAPAADDIVIAKQSEAGKVRVASVAGAGLGRTTATLRFIVRQAGYLDSLRYQFGEAAGTDLTPIVQAEVLASVVDTNSPADVAPRRGALPSAEVAVADLAASDPNTPPAPPDGYRYGDVNADGRISVSDAAIAAALWVGAQPAIGYVVAAANVRPANPPGLGGPEDANPPGRNSDGSFTIGLDDATAIARQAVGIDQSILGDRIPERRFASLTGAQVSPANVVLAPGSKTQFGVVGRFSDGGTGPLTVSWSTNGGTIDKNGVFTAGAREGTYRVIARTPSGGAADTATVVITQATSPAPTLIGIAVAPAAVTVPIYGKQQFSATGQYSDGSSRGTAVSWTATGGAIDQNGLYQAGTAAGSFRVFARSSSGSLADTSFVTISQTSNPPPPPLPPPPPPPPPSGGLWLDEDFSRYNSIDQYRSNPFRWNVSPPAWFHQSQLALDPAEGYGGSRQSLRYDWPGQGAAGCNSDYAISTSYKVPAADELWIEAVHKFAANFNTNVAGRGGSCGFGEYKLLLAWRNVGDRFDLVNGHGGYSWWSGNPQTPAAGSPPQCSGTGAGGNCQVAALGSAMLWDGQWHVYRLHIRINSAPGVKDGVFQIWVDGRLVKNVTNADLTDASTGAWSRRIQSVMLGSNSNSGTSGPTHTWWGRLRIWTGNPGW